MLLCAILEDFFHKNFQLPFLVLTKSYPTMQADSSVDSLLQSLGLEKYLITFRAEEVCFFQDHVFYANLYCMSFTYLVLTFYTVSVG